MLRESILRTNANKQPLTNSVLHLYNNREFVGTFIDFPKPLIAGVNGPAVGISVTLLALCDLIYAADSVRTRILSLYVVCEC